VKKEWRGFEKRSVRGFGSGFVGVLVVVEAGFVGE
jgi:hypothetical protein